MYDVYTKGKYQFTESSDLEHFKVIDHAISMDFHPRHGTVMPITPKELKRLFKVYGKPEGFWTKISRGTGEKYLSLIC